MKNKICFIDFETTGIDVYKDNPIEIGAVLIDERGEILSKFYSFIKPRSNRITSVNAFKIHGIDSKSLIIAPSQNEVLNNFFNQLGTDYRFAGWNINFDVSFFRRMCHFSNRMSDYNKINHRHIDVQSINFLATELGFIDSQYRSLSDLAKLFSIDRNVKHSAIEDAIITSKVYIELINLFRLKIK